MASALRIESITPGRTLASPSGGMNRNRGRHTAHALRSKPQCLHWQRRHATRRVESSNHKRIKIWKGGAAIEEEIVSHAASIVDPSLYLRVYTGEVWVGNWSGLFAYSCCTSLAPCGAQNKLQYFSSHAISHASRPNINTIQLFFIRATPERMSHSERDTPTARQPAAANTPDGDI